MNNGNEDDNLDFVNENFNQYRTDLIKKLKEEKLSYIEVLVNEECMEREDSPIGRIADIFEVSMNLLLVYLYTARAEKSVIQLENLEVTLNNFFKTSYRLLSDDSDNIELVQNEMKRLIKEFIERPKNIKTETPTPKIFFDLLNNNEESN